MNDPKLDKEIRSKEQQEIDGLLRDKLDFGEVLRHELNNPLTGILGNAELLLVEMRRSKIELPQSLFTRLETIASLAVRMREAVHKLSDEWEANTEKANRKILERF